MDKEMGSRQYVGWQYVERKARIKYLSSPSIQVDEAPEEYYRQLQENFIRIRELARENRELLKNTIYPVLEDKGVLLEKDQVACIKELIDHLFNTYIMDNLDAGMAARAADRLLLDAELKGECSYIIEELKTQVLVYYTLMNMCERLQQYSALRERYREKGLRAGERLCRYLEKEKFAELPDEESKISVLEISRFISALYEDKTGNYTYCQRTLEIVKNSLRLAEDKFYREQTPNYDWEYHVVRCYEYAGLATECGNGRCLSKEEALTVYHYMKRLGEILSTKEAQDKYSLDMIEFGMMECRAKFYAGLTDQQTYLEKLVELYGQRDENDYDTRAEFGNLVIPIEYILQLDPSHLSRQECDMLEYIYQNIAGYAVKIPNGGSLSYMMEYFSYLLGNYIELPGGTTFETMCLNCLAALHPPTFVHSVMVGELTRCLCGYLFDENPGIFVGIADCSTFWEVCAHREKIMDFVYHAGCCHDVGKLIFIDTIFIYGRDLTDEEFMTIREHPVVGAALLARNSSTAKYTNIAKGHHRWYDDSAGYPKDFNTVELPDKILVDVVACADCLDAATDTIGRSYSRGIGLDQFVQELDEGCGTRYAPYVCALFHREEVLEEIRALLDRGRKEKYYSTYAVLQNILNRDPERN